MNILKKIPAALIFLLVVFSLLLSSFSHEAASRKEVKKENTAKKKDQKNSSEEIVAPLRAIEAVIPFTKPDLHQDLYFISERKFITITKDFVSLASPHYINVYFKNLFSYVICVNAP
ncbi:MAG: hypothetical protein ACJ75J_18345 [Cytophagaceae bacterium]